MQPFLGRGVGWMEEKGGEEGPNQEQSDKKRGRRYAFAKIYTLTMPKNAIF